MFYLRRLAKSAGKYIQKNENFYKHTYHIGFWFGYFQHHTA